MSVEHKSLRDEILFVIGRSSMPLSSGEIYERCEMVDEMKQVSNALFQLHAAGKIERLKGDGKLTYMLAKGVNAPAPAGKAGRPAAVDIPALGDEPGLNGSAGKTVGTPKADPVEAGLDLVEQAVDVVPRLAAEKLADALLDRTRKQLGRRPHAMRWWIDQDGMVEIVDGDHSVVLDPRQAQRMAQMVLATHEALELI
jgi:hypothetical protein